MDALIKEKISPNVHYPTYVNNSGGFCPMRPDRTPGISSYLYPDREDVINYRNVRSNPSLMRFQYGSMTVRPLG